MAVHGLALVADPWLRASLTDVLVPFSSPHRSGAVALGQVAAGGFLVLGPTYYLVARLGPAGRGRRRPAGGQ